MRVSPLPLLCPSPFCGRPSLLHESRAGSCVAATARGGSCRERKEGEIGRRMRTISPPSLATCLSSTPYRPFAFSLFSPFLLSCLFVYPPSITEHAHVHLQSRIAAQEKHRAHVHAVPHASSGFYRSSFFASRCLSAALPLRTPEETLPNVDTFSLVRYAT
uniref:Uncharacterized protein n=1 Tax=Leishmania guyanensis TaxID=5670 RepID=A0A1E1J935_LEIGU|nr:Hypothetical protein BN36_NA76180 [Leishmania guyanensis]